MLIASVDFRVDRYSRFFFLFFFCGGQHLGVSSSSGNLWRRVRSMPQRSCRELFSQLLRSQIFCARPVSVGPPRIEERWRSRFEAQKKNGEALPCQPLGCGVRECGVHSAKEKEHSAVELVFALDESRVTGFFFYGSVMHGLWRSAWLTSGQRGSVTHRGKNKQRSRPAPRRAARAQDKRRRCQRCCGSLTQSGPLSRQPVSLRVSSLLLPSPLVFRFVSGPNDDSRRGR